MSVKIIKVALPEYYITQKPDYLKIGRKVDDVIEKSFPDGTYVVRSVSIDDHDGVSVDELADVIIEHGTDKYDKGRESIFHEEFSQYDYDIHAGLIEIKNRKLVIPKSYPYPTEFGDIVWHFYEHAPLDRGRALRIDLLVIYDAVCLEKAKKRHAEADDVRKELSDCLYKFKDGKNKKDALVGIIKILR